MKFLVLNFGFGILVCGVVVRAPTLPKGGVQLPKNERVATTFVTTKVEFVIVCRLHVDFG